jgi:hypothetical protein
MKQSMTGIYIERRQSFSINFPASGYKTKAARIPPPTNWGHGELGARQLVGGEIFSPQSRSERRELTERLYQGAPLSGRPRLIPLGKLKF